MEAGNRNVFWGLVIKPGKRYETEVQEPFRITKACIEPATAKDGRVTSVYVECDNNEEFIIANLNLKNFNEGLDLSFNEGEKICFKGKTQMNCPTISLIKVILHKWICDQNSMPETYII